MGAGGREETGQQELKPESRFNSEEGRYIVTLIHFPPILPLSRYNQRAGQGARVMQSWQSAAHGTKQGREELKSN